MPPFPLAQFIFPWQIIVFCGLPAWARGPRTVMKSRRAAVTPRAFAATAYLPGRADPPWGRLSFFVVCQAAQQPVFGICKNRRAAPRNQDCLENVGRTPHPRCDPQVATVPIFSPRG